MCFYYFLPFSVHGQTIKASMQGVARVKKETGNFFAYKKVPSLIFGGGWEKPGCG